MAATIDSAQKTASMAVVAAATDSDPGTAAKEALAEAAVDSVGIAAQAGLTGAKAVAREGSLATVRRGHHSAGETSGRTRASGRHFRHPLLYLLAA